MVCMCCVVWCGEVPLAMILTMYLLIIHLPTYNPHHSSFCKQVGVKRVEMLAAALEENESVEWLDLRNNPIKAQGAAAVARALTHHPSVLRLE